MCQTKSNLKASSKQATSKLNASYVHVASYKGSAYVRCLPNPSDLFPVPGWGTGETEKTKRPLPRLFFCLPIPGRFALVFVKIPAAAAAPATD